MNNWPKYLPQVIEAINNTKNKAIGGLRPSEIKSNLDDVKIDARVGLKEDVEFEQQLKNQAAYDKDKKRLQPGQYVYVPAFPASPLGKSFDSKVRAFGDNLNVLLLNKCIVLFRDINYILLTGLMLGKHQFCIA